MKTKIYYGRDLIGRFNCDGRRTTRLQRVWFKTKRIALRIALVVIALDTIGWASTAGYYIAKSNEPAIVQAQVKEADPVSPVLARIGDCESGIRNKNGKAVKGSATQFKNGQVEIHVNKDGTIDIGKYMINLTYQGDKASKMGLDLMKESDNETYAIWLYQNVGTSPWSASASCWLN